MLAIMKASKRTPTYHSSTCSCLSLSLYCLAAFTLLILLFLMKGTLWNSAFITAAVPVTRLTDEPADIGLYHPAHPSDLWIKVTDNILVRRLAFFDSRNVSHYTVVFNCMYNDTWITKLQPLYALMNYQDQMLCVPLEYWISSGDRNNRERYNEIWYHYILRTVKGLPIHLNPPSYSQLSTDPNCNINITQSIPIKDNKTEREFTYGVCLHKSIYNLTNPQEMVHWVELNLALGVEFMTVYLQCDYIPESFYTVMLPYVQQGIIEVLDWGLKPPLIPGYTKFWGQTSVITECHYRNLYRVKYLGLYDLDEFFIPQNNEILTIPQMINNLEKMYKYETTYASSYVVHNSFFYKRKTVLPELQYWETKRCSNITNWPHYYTYTVRSTQPEKQHPFHKLIIKPKAVISVWTHWVNKQATGYTKEFRIPTNIALTQHYRYPEKKKLTEDHTVSFTISKYFNRTVLGIIDHLCKT